MGELRGKCDLAVANLILCRNLALGERAARKGSLVSMSLGPDEICEGAKKFPGSTGIGSDLVAFGSIAGAPRNGLVELAVVCKEVIENLCWPIQLLLSIMCLLPKKGGDTRTIALLPTFMRLILFLLSPELREWDGCNAIPGDTAVKGVHAYVRTALDHALSGAQFKAGFTVVRVFWDIKKFYDSVSAKWSQKENETQVVPSTSAALAAWAHRAPRRLKGRLSLSRVVASIGRSILAGATSATTEARAMLKKPLARTLRKHKDVKVALHVDDVAMGMASKEKSDFETQFLEACVDFASDVKARELVISDKSAVVSSDPEVASWFARMLRAHGIPIGATGTIDHMGVPFAGGARRDDRPLRGRIAKAKKRAARAGILTRVTKKATMLYKTGVKPMQGCSASIIGATPLARKTAVDNACLVAGKIGVQCCRSTLIAIRLGQDQHPEVSLQVEIVELWCAIWAAASKEESSLTAQEGRRLLIRA